jgi:hypothetical protein
VFFCASHSGSDIQDVNTAIAEGKNAVENNSLLGDWFREKHKNSVEYWKTEIREKIGENTASQILNGIMISYGDTVDFGAGTADTALDAILALGSCTMGMSYCDTALNDLKKADKTVSDAMTSLINGDTWDHVRDVFAKAQKGDQQSLEEVASILTSVLVPSKLVGNAGKVVNKIDNVVPPKAGKGTAANKPLDKTALETQHGKGNVEQGGGIIKKLRIKYMMVKLQTQKLMRVVILASMPKMKKN